MLFYKNFVLNLQFKSILLIYFILCTYDTLRDKIMSFDDLLLGITRILWGQHGCVDGKFSYSPDCRYCRIANDGTVIFVILVYQLFIWFIYLLFANYSWMNFYYTWKSLILRWQIINCMPFTLIEKRDLLRFRKNIRQTVEKNLMTCAQQYAICCQIRANSLFSISMRGYKSFK